MSAASTSVLGKLGIPTGREGSTFDGIHIRESNRATTFEDRASEVALLQKIAHDNYTSKGVRAVLFGTPNKTKNPSRPFKYAVYVQDGFLVPVEGQ